MGARPDSWERDFPPVSSVDKDGEQSTEMPSLDATWSILDREPGMDDLAEGITEILKEMGEDLKIYPYQDTEGKDRLFLCQFEIPKYGEDFRANWRWTIPAAGSSVEEPTDKPFGYLNFLGGIPIDCVEMLVFIGEISSKTKEGEASKVNVQSGDGKCFAPVPAGDSEFFTWPEKKKILLNLTAIAAKGLAEIMSTDLDGEPKPKNHWWLKVKLAESESANKYPVPGEFAGLGVRMFPGEYWGKQKSSPFVYSGNWMDTVYYSGARITEVIDPTDTIAYPTYKVKWHGKDEEITVRPSDFAEYKVDDRVTILKDVVTEKKTQLWKDDDMKTFGDSWQICPISYYGLDTQAGG